jgi:transcriptional regulator with PAS, ATPase and Fis domain
MQHDGNYSTPALEKHIWPGNVRELRNVIERASILVGQSGEIRLQEVPMPEG